MVDNSNQGKNDNNKNGKEIRIYREPPPVPKPNNPDPDRFDADDENSPFFCKLEGSDYIYYFESRIALEAFIRTIRYRQVRFLTKYRRERQIKRPRRY